MTDYPTREDRLKEITDQLEKGIGELFQSGRYAEYLAVMAKFHNYSFSNILLIMAAICQTDIIRKTALPWLSLKMFYLHC